MRQQPAYNQAVHMLLARLFNTIFLLVKREKLNRQVLYVVPKKQKNNLPKSFRPELVRTYTSRTNPCPLIIRILSKLLTSSMVACFLLSDMYLPRVNVTSSFYLS